MAGGGHSSSLCTGLSLSRPLLLLSTGSRRAGSVIVAHGPSCSAGCGIFPDQGSNPCPLHWQADSQPLRHQGSPSLKLLKQEMIKKLKSVGNKTIFKLFIYNGVENQKAWFSDLILPLFSCGTLSKLLNIHESFPLLNEGIPS